MRRLLLLGVLAACGPTSKKEPVKPVPKTLTAKEIATQSNPAIVFIDVGEGDQRGAGTGFIVDPSGVIATNFHVVRGNSRIQVKLFGGEIYKVSHVVGIDPGRDLALIRIEPSKTLPTLKLGDSDQMSAGDQVVAIGNPLGLDHTVSSGLVSQVRPECTAAMVEYAQKNQARALELLKIAETRKPTPAEVEEFGRLQCKQELTYFQISAPISQGSSGGPLFNQAGEVVGVTTAIITAGQNINLAIPTNYLKALVAKPGQIALDEFAAKTKDPEQQVDVERDPPIKLERKIPDHPTALFDGCKGDQIVQLENEIWGAIGVGAPIYNKKEFEACFRIYEGVATKYENNPPCKGIKVAFGDGLVRSSTMDYKGPDKVEALKAWKLKAWAMRDTFDGLLDAAKRWRAANPGKFDPKLLGPNSK